MSQQSDQVSLRRGHFCLSAVTGTSSVTPSRHTNSHSLSIESVSYGRQTSVFFLNFIFILFYVYESLACILIYAPHACLVPMEAARGSLIPWNWIYRRLWAARVLGIQPRSSGRAANTLNSQPSLQSQLFLLLKVRHLSLAIRIAVALATMSQVASSSCG